MINLNLWKLLHRWEFKTDSHDIGFGLYYKDDESVDDDCIEEMIKLVNIDFNCYS